MFNFFTKSNKNKSTKSTTITSSRTSSRVVTLEHEWTIDHYSHLNIEKDKFLSSGKFSPPENPNIEFTIDLYPDGDRGPHLKGFVSLFLGTNIEQNFVLWFKINIKNLFIFSKSCTAKFGNNIKDTKTGKFSPVQGWGWGSVAPKFLLKPMKLGKIIKLNNRPVVVQCKIRYVTDVKTCKII